jgi:hypothetical protein
VVAGAENASGLVPHTGTVAQKKTAVERNFSPGTVRPLIAKNWEILRHDCSATICAQISSIDSDIMPPRLLSCVQNTPPVSAFGEW